MMTRNTPKPKPPPQPQVTVTPGNALWQKVTPETSAHVMGGCSGYIITTG